MRLLPFSHRSSNLNAPNQKIALTPKSPPPPHPWRCSPIHYCKSNPAVTIAHSFPQCQIPRRYHRIIGNKYADVLARKSKIDNNVHTLTLRIPPSKQLALREIPSTTSTGLQKNMKNTESFKITQTQPSHLPQGFGTYPFTTTPCKHTCSHPLHKLGNANTGANSHEYYQMTLVKNGTANGAASNAYLTTSYVPAC